MWYGGKITEGWRGRLGWRAAEMRDWNRSCSTWAAGAQEYRNSCHGREHIKGRRTPKMRSRPLVTHHFAGPGLANSSETLRSLAGGNIIAPTGGYMWLQRTGTFFFSFFFLFSSSFIPFFLFFLSTGMLTSVSRRTQHRCFSLIWVKLDCLVFQTLALTPREFCG